MRLLRYLLMMNTIVTERKIRWHEPFRLHRMIIEAENRSWMRRIFSGWLILTGGMCGVLLVAALLKSSTVDLETLEMGMVLAYFALLVSCVIVLAELFNPHTVWIKEKGVAIENLNALVKRSKITKLTIFKTAQASFLKITYKRYEKLVGLPPDLSIDLLERRLQEWGYLIEARSGVPIDEALTLSKKTG